MNKCVWIFGVLIGLLFSINRGISQDCIPLDILQTSEINDSIDDELYNHVISLDVFDDSYDSCIAVITKYIEGNEIWDDVTMGVLISSSQRHYWNGDYKAAIRESLQAMELSRNHIDSSYYKALIYNALAQSHYELNHNQRAEYYAQEALKIGGPYDSIFIYNTLGNIQVRRDSIKLAISTYALALSLYPDGAEKDATIMANLGESYLKLNKLDSAYKYIHASLVQSQIDVEPAMISYVQILLGRYYKQIGAYKDALSFVHEGIKGAQKYESNQDIILGHRLLSEIYDSLGNYRLAYKNHVDYTVLKESLVNEDKSREVAALEAEYEYAQQKQKDDALNAQVLQRQKYVTYGVFGLLLAVALIGYAFYKNYLNKKLALERQERDNQLLLKEQAKSDRLLLNILPKETAEELKQYGRAEPKSYESVTVLMTDFVGFTNISELLSPEQLVEELDTLFKSFDAITDQFGLEKIKTIGDAYMAVCGLPNPVEDHAIRTIDAAIEMLDTIRKYESPYDVEWQLRIGVNSGKVTAGVVGDKKFAFDIWGDTVNMAARMESAGESGRLNVSDNTYRLIEDHFKGIHRGKIEAKNKGEVDMYFVERA